MRLQLRARAFPTGVLFVPAIFDRSWREAFAGLMASAVLLLLVFPLSFSLLPAVLFATISYAALRLVLTPPTPTIEPADPASDPLPAGVEPPLPAVAPATPESVAPVLPAGEPSPFGLTRRELEILPLLAQRLTDREVAERLSISERTVMNHVASILGKLGLKSRREVGAFLEQHRDRYCFSPKCRDR